MQQKFYENGLLSRIYQIIDNYPEGKHIKEIYENFVETGSVLERPRSGRPRSGTSEGNMEKVDEAFSRSPKKSAFFLWGAIKEEVYQTKPVLLDDLKDRNPVTGSKVLAKKITKNCVSRSAAQCWRVCKFV